MLDLALREGQGFQRMGDMAQRLAVSVKYLEKLLRDLQASGYVISRRGPNGGHGLGKNPADITVGDVVRILEGEGALARCVEVNDYCEHRTNCLMNWVWEEASQAMFARLDKITFADLAKEAELRQLTCDFSTTVVSKT